MASSSGCLVGLLFETLALPSADHARLISRTVSFVALFLQESCQGADKLYNFDIVTFVADWPIPDNVPGEQTLFAPPLPLRFLL
jgi:hypothetical protein